MLAADVSWPVVNGWNRPAGLLADIPIEVEVSPLSHGTAIVPWLQMDILSRFTVLCFAVVKPMQPNAIDPNSTSTALVP